METVMTCSSPQQHPNNYRPGRRASSSRGFTLIELLIVVAIAAVLSAIAIPAIRSSLQIYTLRSAAASLTGAIQSTRYQAIFHGCQYQVAFNPATYSYTVLGQAPAAGGTACTGVFAAVGPAVPLTGRGVTLGAAVTVQFSPGGSVSAPVGTMSVAAPITLTYGGLPPEQISVSNYGKVSVVGP